MLTPKLIEDVLRSASCADIATYRTMSQRITGLVRSASCAAFLSVYQKITRANKNFTCFGQSILPKGSFSLPVVNKFRTMPTDIRNLRNCKSSQSVFRFHNQPQFDRTLRFSGSFHNAQQDGVEFDVPFHTEYCKINGNRKIKFFIELLHSQLLAGAAVEFSTVTSSRFRKNPVKSGNNSSNTYCTNTDFLFGM